MSNPGLCPIPIGWTVSVSRMPSTNDTITGIEIRATHESGHEIVDYWRKANESKPTTQLRLPGGSVDISPKEFDRRVTAFLWVRVYGKIERWNT